MKPLLASILCLTAPFAHAAVLVEYNFENNLDASNPATGITATGLTNNGFTSLSYATNAVPIDGVDAIQGTYSAALNLPDIQTGFSGAAPSSTVQLFSPPPSPATGSAGKSFEFTLTPADQMRIDDITLNLYGDLNTTANWSPLNLFATLYIDIGQTGSFTEIGTATSHGETNVRDWTIRTLDGDPGDAGAQSILTTNQATDFRLVITDGGGGNGSRWNGLDHIVVNGAVIPEPGTAILLLGGMGFFAIGRRRRRS